MGEGCGVATGFGEVARVSVTLLLDSNEARNHLDLLELLQVAIPTQVSNMNQSPGQSLIYPDAYVWESGLGINFKTVNEVLSSLDQVEDQLMREIAGPCKMLVLNIRGVMRPDPNGGCWAYQFNWQTSFPFPNSLRNKTQSGQVTWQRTHFATSFKGIKAWEASLQAQGVMIQHSYDIPDLAEQLIALHNWSLKGGDHKTLHRLIKSEVGVRGLTPQETQFAKCLMSCGANWGEELALTVAALGLTSVGDLFRLWDEGGQLCDTLIREKQGVRTRRIGTAAEQRLQRALGYEVQPRVGNAEPEYVLNPAD